MSRPPSTTLQRLTALALVAGLAACGPAEPADGGAPPGADVGAVVLVTMDTVRADHMPFHGYPRATAPFLAELADQGVVFERAMATMSHTAPSHASLLTGLTPARHGLRVNGETLDPGLPTLASLFSAQGWSTGAFTAVRFLVNVAADFDVAEGRWRPGREVTDAALAWLETLPPGRPLFLWVHYYDAHEWFSEKHAPDQRVAAMRAAHEPDDEGFYDLVAGLHGLPDPPPGEPFPPLDWGRISNRDQVTRPFLVSDRAGVLEAIDQYDGRIAEVDAQVRRLHRGVTRHLDGAASLWVVTSDHGEGLGSHAYYGHGKHVYQEQLHVPLVVAASDGRFGPARVPDLVSLVDVAPTLAELVTGPSALGRDLEGRSLARLLTGGRDARARLAFGERRPADAFRTEELGWADERVTTLQRGALKLILRGEDRAEVYDLAADPLELRGLDEDARTRELVELMAIRDAWLADRHPGRTTFDPGELDPELLEELRALGYVGDGDG